MSSLQPVSNQPVYVPAVATSEYAPPAVTPGFGRYEKMDEEEASITQSNWTWTAAKTVGILTTFLAFGVFMHQAGVNTAAYHAVDKACGGKEECINKLFKEVMETMPITNNGLSNFVVNVTNKALEIGSQVISIGSRIGTVVEVSAYVIGFAGSIWALKAMGAGKVAGPVAMGVGKAVALMGIGGGSAGPAGVAAGVAGVAKAAGGAPSKGSKVMRFVHWLANRRKTISS